MDSLPALCRYLNGADDRLYFKACAAVQASDPIVQVTLQDFKGRITGAMAGIDYTDLRLYKRLGQGFNVVRSSRPCFLIGHRNQVETSHDGFDALAGQVYGGSRRSY